MRDDSERAVFLNPVAKGFIDGHRAAFAVEEGDVALRDHRVAYLHKSCEIYFTAGVSRECKARIVRIGRIASHEVGEGALEGGAERLHAVGERGLEHNARAGKVVIRIQHFSGDGRGILSIGLCGSDAD